MEMKIMTMMKEKAGVNDILADRHAKKEKKEKKSQSWMDRWNASPPLPSSSFLNVND